MALTDAPTVTTDQLTELQAGIATARATFDSGRTRPLAWRKAQLDGLLRVLKEGEAELSAALATDLGKPTTEGWAADIGTPASEIRHIRKHLAKWMAPRKAKLPMSAQPGKGTIVPEPLGVALIIAPWNYPVQLLIEPLAAALAAGNAAVLKPSELAPATAEVLTTLLRRHLDNEAIFIANGGVDVSTALLAEKFDHIFFTGSTSVGRVVMKAAAEHLTPVTLELGGKSPTIIDSSARIDVTAKRLVWSKFLNAGQTCVAPDYVLVTAQNRDALLDQMAEAISTFYGDDPAASPDLARIVNRRHLDRLAGYLQAPGAGTVAIGGQIDAADRFMAPTVVLDPELDTPLMTDEIFGPILPIVTVADLDEAIAFVNARPKPLALYLFAEDDAAADQVIASTSSGSVCVNHAVVQILPAELPFGGVGESGMGRYHGKSGFETFSNMKSVMQRPTKLDPPVAYPPTNAFKDRLIRKLL
ncbi:MAG: aldehyde dehydrogenase family protein [Acidimicrobiales bacterium]|nr:aldehyde dehydrogenase family protein [Acidimicrobiales bacterium]